MDPRERQTTTNRMLPRCCDRTRTARNTMRRSDAGRASGSLFGGNGRESGAPGAASAARAGVRFSFAGRSPDLRRGRSGPALLRAAPRCSCGAVTCGDRGVSRDMGRRPLVRRRWRPGAREPASGWPMYKSGAPKRRGPIVAPEFRASVPNWPYTAALARRPCDSRIDSVTPPRTLQDRVVPVLFRKPLTGPSRRE